MRKTMTRFGLLLGALVWLAPSSLLAQTVVKYVHTDALGSVVAMTNSSGGVIETAREYEPYGYQMTPAIQDGPGYTGHVQDAATGLTYMQQRYYDPQLGVFLSVDPVTAYSNPIGAFHRYRYAENNPYTNTDPDGRACNGNGCWVTREERAAAAAGDYKTYYRLAAAGGDTYAARALEVATMTGSDAKTLALTVATNARLAASIYSNLPDSMSFVEKAAATMGAMEKIREGLPSGHVAALDSHNASPENPVQLDRTGDIDTFHRAEFVRNGADPSAFGGTTYDSLGTSTLGDNAAGRMVNGALREQYDWCPPPSCSP